jgi:hypothetical protein
LESRGAALWLIATMLDTDLAPSDRAAAVFPGAGAMCSFVPALAIHPLSVSRCRVRNALDDVAVVLPLRASLPTPTSVRTMARDDGRALLAWPQRWSCCRERFA